MKTVDMLAKYLNEWPCRYVRIVQGGDCIFYGVLSVNELAFEAIPGERLAGLTLSEDHGTSVTCHEWLSAQRTEMEKGNTFDISRAIYAKEKSEEEYRRDDLYRVKLQCLHEAIIKDGTFDKSKTELIANSISAAFDKITF